MTHMVNGRYPGWVDPFPADGPPWWPASPLFHNTLFAWKYASDYLDIKREGRSSDSAFTVDARDTEATYRDLIGWPR